MPLIVGSCLGPYQITASLGAGGMGEVYRATDTKLKRQVALKVLPGALTADPDRLARFQREAEVLASLNHPHIAVIYGLEDSTDTKALVMELVEGPTLADRIAQGPIPVDEALPIAKQIAEALEAAHEQGVIHRDLKPANIKVRQDGAVKVLDFGIAKPVEPAGIAPDASQASTLTSPAMTTGVGVLLGTAAYMSPEQVRGNPVDKRTDIWAFGCVLYEMLTGQPAFAGDDVAAVLARVIEREPDWNVLPPSVPPRVRELLRLCLEKNPKRRRQAAGDVRIDVELALTEPAVASTMATSAPQRARPPWTAAAAGAVLAIALTGSAWWYLMRPTPPRVTRTTIPSDPAAPLTANGPSRDLAISPDGTRVVYVGANDTRLVVRALDQLQSTVLPGLGRPNHPIFSPDGQWIAFFDATNALKKVPTTGGPPQTLTVLTGAPRGASWGPDDTIIFATLDPASGLLRVPAAGGKPEVLTTPEPTQGEVEHLWPELLPGGEAVLFTIVTQGGLGEAQVGVLDLRTRERRVVLRGGSHAQYVAPGFLVYGVGTTLRAVRFDLRSREATGTAAPVVESLKISPQGATEASIAGDGSLVYVPQSASTTARTLVWVDRQGREEPLGVPPQAYATPRLSPDGTRVAINTGTAISIWDLAQKTEVRFAPGGASPVWSADGRRLIWVSAGTGQGRLFSQPSDGTGKAEGLIGRQVVAPYSAVPDGRRLIVRLDGRETGVDIGMLALVGEHGVTPLVRTPFDERNGEISPDGRWLLYESSESGQPEIYVRPFPAVDTGRWQVSTTGGRWPVWARHGREIFFRALDGAVIGVPVDITAESSVRVGTAMRLVGPRYLVGGAGNREYDVSPDGKRLLMIKEGTGPDDTPAPPSIVVVQHFDEELERLVPN